MQETASLELELSLGTEPAFQEDLLKYQKNQRRGNQRNQQYRVRFQDQQDIRCAQNRK